MKEKFIHLAKNYPALIAAILISPYLIAKALVGGDFIVYMAAAEQLRQGKDCYNVFLNYQGGTWYSMYGYSPFFAILLIPLTYLPAFIPQFLFLIADVFMIFRLLRLTEEWLGIDLLANKKWWYALLLLFSLRFILHNFEMVQLNILVLWLTVEGLNQIFFRNNTFTGALLLALGINFKLLPLVFIPYLLWRAKFKAFTYVLAISVLLAWLPGIWLGNAFNLQLHLEWFAIINPMNDQFNAGQNVNGCGIHGIAALVASYFSKNTNNDFQFLIADLSSETQLIIINAFRFLLVAITLLFLRTAPFKDSSSKKHFITEVAYILLVTPLLFPQQNKWAYVYIAPALAVIFYNLLQQGKRDYLSISLLVVVFMLTTLTTNGLIGWHLNHYTECVKLITIGSLILIPLLYRNAAGKEYAAM